MAAPTFQKFCDDFGGIQKLAKKLRMTDRSVAYYYSQFRAPTLRVMQRLIKISGYTLTYESIIDSTQPPHEREC